jgi:bifunctional DNA-binding transcriptional regulator/antitoxin component of YhaV-PrlF toxin-antitoxin module
MKRLLWAILIFLITINLAGVDKIEVKTINGVQVVFNPKNPAPPKGTPAKLTLKDEFSLGEGKKEEEIFSEISSIAVDDEGNIYLLDGKENKILVFDKKGKYLKSFGKKGQGPGEMGGPSGIHLTPAKELLVDDSLNRKLIFFSLDGKFLRNISTATFFGLGGVELDSQGNMIAQVVIFANNKINREIKKFDKDLNPLFTVANYDFPNIMAGKINPFSVLTIYRVGKDGTIFISNLDQYEIKVLNSEGKVIKRILKEYEPVKTTEEHKKEMLERIPPDFPFRDRLELPKALPPYRDFFLDEQGRIFVKTYEIGKTKEEHFFDIFDAAGNYIARLALKGEEHFIKGERLYSVEETEDGFQVLKCYSVRWEK